MSINVGDTVTFRKIKYIVVEHLKRSDRLYVRETYPHKYRPTNTRLIHFLCVREKDKDNPDADTWELYAGSLQS